MSDVVDDDTEQAVCALWATSGPLVTLLGNPVTGRLKSTPDRPLVPPYASLACAATPGAQRYTGGVRIDRRKVTITLYGVRADVVTGLALALGLLNDQLGRPATAKAPAVVGLGYPSGARFVRWLPLDDGEITQDPDTARGMDLWRGTVTAEVRSVRAS